MPSPITCHLTLQAVTKKLSGCFVALGSGYWEAAAGDWRAGRVWAAWAPSTPQSAHTHQRSTTSSSRSSSFWHSQQTRWGQ